MKFLTREINVRILKNVAAVLCLFCQLYCLSLSQAKCSINVRILKNVAAVLCLFCHTIVFITDEMLDKCPYP